MSQIKHKKGDDKDCSALTVVDDKAFLIFPGDADKGKKPKVVYAQINGPKPRVMKRFFEKNQQQIDELKRDDFNGGLKVSTFRVLASTAASPDHLDNSDFVSLTKIVATKKTTGAGEGCSTTFYHAVATTTFGRALVFTPPTVTPKEKQVLPMDCVIADQLNEDQKYEAIVAKNGFVAMLVGPKTFDEGVGESSDDVSPMDEAD